MSNVLVILTLLMFTLSPITCATIVYRDFNEYQNKLNSVKIGDCYKKLGQKSLLCVTGRTKNFVELTDKESNIVYFPIPYLFEETYTKVDKK